MYQSRGPALPGSETDRLILGLIQSGQATTQTELVQASGLKQQAISRAVGHLVDLGLLRTGPRLTSGRRGQPSIVLELNPDHLFTLGVSIMADAVSLMIMDLSSTARGYLTLTPPDMSRTSVLEATSAALDQLCQDTKIHRDKLVGIGVGITGFALEGGRRFNPPASLEDWAQCDVAALFEAFFHVPVWADNDGNVAAAGESLVGVGLWARTFAYFYIATGFGGGLVLDGRLVRGVHGNAGEFAAAVPQSLYVPPTLDLLRHCYAQRGQGFDTIGALLAELDVTAPAVDDWLNRISDSLSLACSASWAILDPDAIVLGGRLPRALAERMIQRIELRNAPVRGLDRPRPRIVPSEVTGDATALGAAALPLKHLVFA
ncbi:MAG: ROK family transcriptional regulator [Asticcacaulis sp.]